MGKRKGISNRNTTTSRYSLALLAFGVALIVLAVVSSSSNINRDLNAEIQENLRDVATQNGLTISNEIKDKFTLLYSIADELTTGGASNDAIMAQLTAYTDRYGFKRMTITSPDGLAVTTDGYIRDLSYQDFYQDALNGISGISVPLTDALGTPEPIIIFCVPVYGEDGSVEHVLSATYRTEKFHEILDVTSFDGHGFSCIINQDADILAASDSAPEHLQASANFYDYLAECGENTEALTILEERIGNAEPNEGNGTYAGDDDTYSYYMVPLNNLRSDRQWYAMTIIPSAELSDRARPIRLHVQKLIAIVLGISFIGIFLYVHAYRTQKKQLLKLAYHDTLTDSDNYTRFKEKVRQSNLDTAYYVALDLQNFKIINTVCGVSRGDDVLREVWRIINSNLMEGELAAHVSADRFIILMIEKDRRLVELRLQRLEQELEAVSNVLNVPRIFPVMGVYETRDHQEPEQIYGKAVQAKHIIKGKRTRHYAFYDELDIEQINEQRTLEDDFETALQCNEFHIWCQPKVEPDTGHVIGAEALIRWHRPDGTILPPGKFIPLFESNGNITTLDEYVFRTVCAEQCKRRESGGVLYPISVNLSRMSLYFRNVVEKYREILEFYQLEPKWVPLEITESAAVNNSEISHLTQKFHDAGFKLLLDDFGSGYSSLASLNDLQFDTIKLDKSLIDHIGDHNGEEVLRHTIELVQELGMSITAEGVETADQLEFLKALHCDDIQGYYFSKPLPIDAFKKFVDEH